MGQVALTMAWTRGLFSLVVLGPASAFVTPSLTGNVPAPYGRTQVVSEVAPVYEAVIGSAEPAFSDAARNIAIGVMLGFLVGFSSLAAPVRAVENGVNDMTFKSRECIRQLGCTGSALEAWAKQKQQSIDPGDPKPTRHSIPTTGAGRYRMYGNDSVSPIPSIANTTDGSYVDNTEKKLALEKAELAVEAKRLASVLGRNPNSTTYSPYNAYQPRVDSEFYLEGTKINLNVTAAK